VLCAVRRGIGDTAEGQKVFLDIFKNQSPNPALFGFCIRFSEIIPTLCYGKRGQTPSSELNTRGLKAISAGPNLAAVSLGIFLGLRQQ